MLASAHRRWCAACVGSALLLLGPIAARASILPVSQDRSVGIGGGIRQFDPDTGELIDERTFSDSASAPDFGPFQDSVGIALRLGSSTVDGFSGQTSSITPDVVTFSGLADLNAAVFADFEEANGSSVTNFDLGFDVVATEVWRLTANLSKTGSGFADLTLTLDDAIVLEVTSDTGFFDELVTLTPGHWVLSVNGRASGFAFPFDQRGGRAELSVRFAVPEPAPAALLAAGLAALARGRRAKAESGSRGQREALGR